MAFTNQEVEKMQSIFKHLEPKTIECIQDFRADLKFRLCATIGLKNPKKQYVYVYQYFQNLSPTRKKILDKRKKEIPYPLNYVELENNFICIGWKWEQIEKAK